MLCVLSTDDSRSRFPARLQEQDDSIIPLISLLNLQPYKTDYQRATYHPPTANYLVMELNGSSRRHSTPYTKKSPIIISQVAHNDFTKLFVKEVDIQAYDSPPTLVFIL